MAKGSDKKSGERPADPADFSHLADALKDMPHVPLHPLMAHPAAAVAAATAIGFGIATQMTSAFLGSLQAAMEASNATARRQDGEQEEAGAAEDAPEPKAAKPVAKTKKSVTKAARPKVAKPAAAKSAPVDPVPEKQVSAGAKASSAKPAAAKSAVAQPAVAKPAAKAQPATKRKPAAAGKRAGKGDDLKKISGIGPKLEQVLSGMGVSRYADIAGWSDADIARIDGELGLSGRILRDDWVGQAKALGGGKA